VDRYACNKTQTESNIAYKHRLCTETAEWISLMLLGLLAEQKFRSVECYFSYWSIVFSLSLSLGLWDDRFVKYRTLRTIYVGGAEGYRLTAGNTYWKELLALITHLGTRHFVTCSCIKYFNVLNPQMVCICTRFRNLNEFRFLPGNVIFSWDPNNKCG